MWSYEIDSINGAVFYLDGEPRYELSTFDCSEIEESEIKSMIEALNR